ncbi:MAG: hypothetical protein HON23_05165, partial [Rickettsiales bacterium]|nr:hypothetical protein [Rickettsiales bacterium]
MDKIIKAELDITIKKNQLKNQLYDVMVATSYDMTITILAVVSLLPGPTPDGSVVLVTDKTSILPPVVATQVS